MFVQFGRQFIENLIGTVGRFCLPILDDAPECGESVVQLDGEIERILTASVSDLVQIFPMTLKSTSQYLRLALPRRSPRKRFSSLHGTIIPPRR